MDVCESTVSNCHQNLSIFSIDLYLLRGADWDSYIFVIKSQLFVTKFISCHKIRDLSHKSQFCVTKLNFLSHNSILPHKSQFCVTKLNFMSQNWIWCHKIFLVAQKSILFNRIQFCVTKFKYVTQNSILCNKIQFCVTKFNSVVHKLIFVDSAFQFFDFVSYAHVWPQGPIAIGTPRMLTSRHTLSVARAVYREDINKKN